MFSPEVGRTGLVEASMVVVANASVTARSNLTRTRCGRKAGGGIARPPPESRKF